jgi:hypothetical protein
LTYRLPDIVSALESAPAADQPNPRDSRRLWSLWDMMRFYADKFVHIMQSLAAIRAGLEILGPLMTANKLGAGGPYTTHPSQEMQANMEQLVKHLEDIGLVYSAKSAGRLISTLMVGRIVNPTADATAVADLFGRIKDEMEVGYFFSLSVPEKKLFEAESAFGDKVAESFPSLTYEVGEAAKCLALGRSTAAAFHSIRCLEAAIFALSRCLSIPDPIKAADRNWGKMLGFVKAGVDRRWPTPTDRLSGDGQFFDELYGSLSGMQNPYRNATMHLDKVYTEDDARHIFEAAGGLMRRVASRCDEDGKPQCP